MQINLIAAVAKNLVTGNQGKLPWHIPADLQRFKELTTGHAVIMGRETWNSIGGVPLEGRRNIVLTSRAGADWEDEELLRVSAKNAALVAKGKRQHNKFPFFFMLKSIPQFFDGCQTYLKRPMTNYQYIKAIDAYVKEGSMFCEMFFIGGHGVWLEAARHATKMYLTVVDGEHEGDAFFPATLPGTWHETQREKHYGYSFCTLEKMSQDGEFSVQDYVKLV